MGMDAEILAVGPFHARLAEHLPFPAKFYAGTQEGATVLRFLFPCATSGESWLLAECLQIDPWNFNQHKFDPHQLDEDLLLDRTGRLAEITSFGWSFDVEKEWKSFVALRDAGFDFYFLPNG